MSSSTNGDHEVVKEIVRIIKINDYKNIKWRYRLKNK